MKIPVLFALTAVWLVLSQAVSAQEASLTKSSIQVHGSWLIEVFDPDGSKVDELAFENALVGPQVLAAAIMGDLVIGGIYVLLESQTGGTGPCSNGECSIIPSGLTIGTTPDSTNLSVTQTGTNSETVHLSGSVTASTSATIDLVRTWTCQCGQATSAAACASNPDSCGAFTSKSLTSGVAVSSGQIVQVTVDLTFQ